MSHVIGCQDESVACDDETGAAAGPPVAADDPNIHYLDAIRLTTAATVFE
jgi:hypothetical protein